MTSPDPQAVHTYLAALQQQICSALEDVDGEARFIEDPAEYPNRGVSWPRILEGGRHIEKAAVNFTHARGDRLPPAATARKPELAGRGFEAVSMSLIVHPRNPYAPTTHANLRFFVAAGGPEQKPIWWFGGGFDLTPYYGFDEDCVHWHQQAHDSVAPFGAQMYARFKDACDAYFFLPHRNEPRGVGGLFFEDFNALGFTRTFEMVQSVGDHFLPAYLPILGRRIETPYGARERDFQLYRRGRYVEFNLVYDRGTKYGLQSGRRIEAVLASMPPMVRWQYDHTPPPDSAEAALMTRYLTPRDWLSGG
ncbi:MAG: oxygen-dependent coproporphyrinogen oxidase [Myxococcota bacterium]